MVGKYPVRSLGSALLSSVLLIACGEAVPFHGVNTSVIQPNVTAFDAKSDLTKTFQSGKTQSVNLSLNSGFANLTQTFTLEQNPRQQELYTQVERAIFTDTFTQGHKGISAEQSFSVAEAGVFDLLIVIDNSSSMGPYQSRFAKTLPDILRHISNTNWRIAVVTTSSPCLRKTSNGTPYISKKEFVQNAALADAEFQGLIKVGETGNPVEKGIYAATQGMLESGCESGNVAWLRPDSQRSVLLLTDEINCGSAPNEGCPGAAWESADYFFSRVGKGVTVNAMLLTQEPPNVSSDPLDPNRDCENSGGYAEAPNPLEYYRMVTETGGRFVDLCRANYSTVLDQISQDVGNKINVQYELAFPAELSSLDIKIDGKKVNTYNVNGKILSVLEPLSEKNGTIVVSYKHSPVPMVKNFAPTKALDSSTIEVLVDGKTIPTKDFSFNSATGKVELRDLPAELSQVKVRYRDNANLPKVFSYLQESYPGSLEITVNGIKTTAFQVDTKSRKITLTDAPRDGQGVYLTYELPGDRRTVYPILGVLNDEIEDYTVVDAASGETLESTLESGVIRLEAPDVAGGRVVEARYNLKNEYEGKTFVLETEKLPFLDTLKISANGDEKLCSNDVSIKGGKISFSCQDEDFEKIDVSYQYADDYRNSFDVSVDFSGPKTYRVFINGVESKSHHIIDERVVILKKDLPPDSEVKVIIHPEVI